MGFKIPWSLIYIGLFGDDEISPVVTRADLIEYLDGLLVKISAQTDDAIALFCAKDNFEKFDSILKKLANDDKSDRVIQKRKWRALLLKTTIENITKDYLQGMLELMDFWVSMGEPEDCPHIFPDIHKGDSLQKYFTRESYELNINKNQEWLEKEIISIISTENQT